MSVFADLDEVWTRIHSGGVDSSQLAHQRTTSPAVLLRCAGGRPARQMSPMIWNGIHRLPIGMIQPQNAQARARRCSQSKRSALILARRNQARKTMIVAARQTEVMITSGRALE